MRIVVALGGNAITQPSQDGRVEEQFANSRLTATALADLVEHGHNLVITHGNGPQIGNFLLRNEAAAGRIYPLPMEVAVAHVQGGMGFMIAETLTNELARRHLDRPVTALITMIEVNHDDPSFAHPSKPIGRILTKQDADYFAGAEGWRVKEVAPGKFRRVVPSPDPIRIVEHDIITRSVEAGDLLVVCGGGGIPVVRRSDGALQGVPAVIDKDLASALLAANLNFDAMMILTNVERIAVDFGKPTQRDLERMTLDEARGYMADGQFPEGSMGPKVQAAINFLELSSREDAFVVIGPLTGAAEAFAGRLGTRVIRSADERR
ncbi:MAG: carbamate kinase [Planctomycetota bacterium]|jgi:carbamate kinase